MPVKKSTGSLLVFLGVLCSVGLASAVDVPNELNLQGRLLDDQGQPLEDAVDIAVRIYPQLSGGSALYQELHRNVPLREGMFNLVIGQGSFQAGTLDASTFASADCYLDLEVEEDVLTPRIPFNSVAFAFQAQNADSVGGLDVGNLVTDVTAGDGLTGGGAGGSVSLAVDPSLVQTRVSSSCPTGQSIRAIDQDGGVTCESLVVGAHTHSGSDITSGSVDEAYLDAAVTRDSELSSALAEYYTDSEVDTLVASLQTQITGLQNTVDQLTALLQNVSRVGDEITFSGVNVHVVNGTGTTDGTVNGLGNLIVGYNENAYSATRTGSHNLVVGYDHEYTSYAGLVAGHRNTLIGASASVSGGESNTAGASYSSVSGGYLNETNGGYSSISRGYQNTAIGLASSVSGGQENTASNQSSSVSGGRSNDASGLYSSINGGEGNEVSGEYSNVSGGYQNTASGNYSSVSGGGVNEASGVVASISGGASGTASGEYSSVSGGQLGTASIDYTTVAGSTGKVYVGSSLVH